MTFKLIIIFFSLFIITSCGSGSSSSGSSSDAGISIEVMASHYPGDTLQITNTASGKSFTNTEGITIELTTAYLVIWSVEFTTDCSTLSFARLLDFMISSAHAHSDENPLLMNTPNVINILGEDYTEVYLGYASPPPGNYCGAEIQLLKADDDTVHLPEDIDMVNRLLYIEGNYKLTPESQPLEFIIDISKAALPKSLHLNPTIHVSDSSRTGQFTLGIYYDRWFNAIDMSAIAFDPTQQDQLLNNILNSLH